jgi:hypothetical protein
MAPGRFPQIEQAWVESRVDQAAAELWGITDRELREIRWSLKELG